MHSETNHAKADLKFAAAWGPKCCNPVLIGCHERELISFVKKKISSANGRTCIYCTIGVESC